MFYIQLGPFMAVYATQVGLSSLTVGIKPITDPLSRLTYLGWATQEGALVSTGRALFGDFDIDKILDNSKGYINTILFLMYLFTAVFIMLSSECGSTHTVPTPTHLPSISPFSP